MKRSRTNIRILSALSMATAAALFAKSATASQTLSIYYGNDPNYANSNNAVIIGSGYNPASSNLNAQGEPQVFSSETNVSITPGSTAAQTITVPVGAYLSLAIDAVLTGNVNPSAGVVSVGNKNVPQPAYMGLSELGVAVSSSDANAALLTPIASAADTPGTPDTTVNGVPTYTSTAAFNNTFGSNGGGYNVAPTWGLAGPGNVAPNLPGFSGSYNQGGVGYYSGGFPFPGPNLVGFPDAGNAHVVGANVSELEQFAASDNAANYSNSTEFFDNMIFQALQPGTVTLNTFDITNATEYWTNTSNDPLSTTAPTSYQATLFNGTVNNAPLLVIDISQTVPEPASLGVLGLGALGLLRRRQRQQA